MADSVRQFFEENEISCWMAPNDILAGSVYEKVIIDALENCSCLLLLLTNASQTSPQVAREVELAISCRKQIVPMQLEEDLELTTSFQYYLSRVQKVSVKEISVADRGFQQILAVIKELLG